MPLTQLSEAASSSSIEYPRLRKFNLGLACVTAALGLFLAISPVIPQLTYLIKSKRTPTAAPYGGFLGDELYVQNDGVDPGMAPSPLQSPPTTNQLVIPGIYLNETILEGNTIATADKGPWRRPLSGNPEAGGNTVIVGHRWTYRAARDIFFHLDKIKVGDPVAIYWNQKEYVYTVTEIKTVLPHEIWVEEQTEKPTITLYTCTPVWSSKQRLVVRGELQTDPFSRQVIGAQP